MHEYQKSIKVRTLFFQKSPATDTETDAANNFSFHIKSPRRFCKTCFKILFVKNKIPSVSFNFLDVKTLNIFF